MTSITDDRTSALDQIRFRVHEAKASPEGLLVLFHGRATDERDLFPLLGKLDPDKRLVGVTPRGPLNLPPGGAHWYVVERVGYPDRETFASTYSMLESWLDALWSLTGITPERTILGGFSQGAVMSLALGLGSGRPRPAGILAMSGFIPTVDGWTPDLEPPLPRIAIGHGTLDAVISVEYARQAREMLDGPDVDLTYREYPLPHAVDPQFLGEMQTWVDETLPRQAAPHQ